MKKTHKNLLKVIGIIFGIFLIISIGYMIKITMETASMFPLESNNIVDN